MGRSKGRSPRHGTGSGTGHGARRGERQEAHLPEPQAPESRALDPRALPEGAGRSGIPLDTETRQAMEARFGHDLSRIRIHPQAEGAGSAQALGAAAYTVGRDIVFAPGRYQPGTAGGRALLAHELTHAIQQEGAVAPARLTVGPSHDRAEEEADRIGREVYRESVPDYLRDTFRGGKVERARHREAIQGFHRSHDPQGLEERAASLEESPEAWRSEVRERSPLLQVRRAACGAGSERERMEEELPGDDEMVLQIFQFFYPDLGPPPQLNDTLRQLAAEMLAQAIRGSRAMDMVPRPPRNPSPGWLFSEAVKAVWRRGMDEGIYVAVRNQVAVTHRSAYELAKMGI
jgi:hypothetical protein